MNESRLFGGGSSMPSILKQPLLHFLLAGVLIFVAYEWKGDAESGEDATEVIHIDQEVLLDFMQFRAQAFNRDLFAHEYDAMTAVQRQDLIDAYIREEVFFREAVRLGLDEGDYDIRQRMMQKMNFILEDIASTEAEQIEPDETELERYYRENTERYRTDASYTFSHIYFDREQQGDEAARQMAEKLLPILVENSISVEQAGEFGDRFRYLRNYLDRSQEQISNNFGPDFVERIDQLQISDSIWQGPISSRLGWHLILLSDRTESKLLDMASVRDHLLQDYLYDQRLEVWHRQEQQLIDKYEVRIEIP